MKIGHLDTSERVVIVAEIGLNHEGDVRTAEELVHRAADAGADAVKFQVYQAEKYADPSDTERYERLERFELPQYELRYLATLSHDLGVAFIATPFDLESADLCVEICDAVKIASKDIDFWPLVERVADSDVPMIVSTGMSDMYRVRRSLGYLQYRGVSDDDLALLHCVSAYPVPHEQAELAAIACLTREFTCFVIGYSDHTLSMNASSLAVALGARIIEKHLTLDKNYSDFRDHAVSATPDEFAVMVRRIRQAEELLGNLAVRVQPCERDTIQVCERERAFRESVLTR